MFEAVTHKPHALFQALEGGNHRIHLFHQIAADEVGDQWQEGIRCRYALRHGRFPGGGGLKGAEFLRQGRESANDFLLQGREPFGDDRHEVKGWW